MRPSLGRDAVLDVPLFVLKAFDRLFDHTTTIAESNGNDVHPFAIPIVKGHSYTTRLDITLGGGTRYTVTDNTAKTPPEIWPAIGKGPYLDVKSVKWTGATANIGDEFYSNSATPNKRFTFSPGQTQLLDSGSAGTPNTCTGMVGAVKCSP
jgi:hypothetical protein